MRYKPDGTETRREIIGSALWDVRESVPGANVVDVGDWVERYLVEWEAAKGALDAPEPVVISEFPAHRALAQMADEAFVRRCRELNEAVERFARGGKP